MRIFLIALFFFAVDITSGRAISFDEARHLLSRTSFGGDYTQIQALTRMQYHDAVNHLLSTAPHEPGQAELAWLNEPLITRRQVRQMGESERQQLRRKLRMQAFELKGWWMKEMVRTDAPLVERMTLFWHNHFTSGLRKVKVPILMRDQNMLLRKHALGNFRQLLHAVSKDPAMIIYLDNVSNVRGKPNENFARELLELFTLGEGHYSEDDIKEAARAFTGWGINRNTAKYRFFSRRHDFGHKTFMGQTANFNGDDIINIILQQPRVANHIAEKLWREFVSASPDSKEIDRLAIIFRNHNYEIKPLLQALLSSSSFRDARNRGTMIKSPVELLVGTLRIFKVPVGSGQRLAFTSRTMGQDLFDPPNVKGWVGGTAWITSDTLLMRQQIIERFFRGREMQVLPKKFDGTRSPNNAMSMKLMQEFGKGLDTETIAKVLLPIPPVEAIDSKMDRSKLIPYLVLDPVYQLK